MQFVLELVQLSATIATLIAVPLSVYFFMKALEYQSDNIKLSLEMKITEQKREMEISRFEKSISSILEICEFSISDFDNPCNRKKIYEALLYSNSRLYGIISPIVDSGNFIDSEHLNKWRTDLLNVLRDEAAKF